MPEKDRDLIRLLTQQGLTKTQAKRELNESDTDWNWMQTWLYKKIENTLPPGAIDQRVDALRDSRKVTKTTLKVDINTDLYDLIDFLSRGWPTADKPSTLTKQKVVELLLTHYLTDHTDEAIEVLSICIERMDNGRKATRARKTGFRTHEDDRDNPLGPDYERPE